MTIKRARSNSVSGVVSMTQAIIAANQEPTEPLNEVELKAFRRILQSREADSWSAHDIGLATQCAQQMVLASEYTARLKLEGPVIQWTTPNGNVRPAANPMLLARSNAFSTVANLTKLLGLSASQKGLSGAPQAKRNLADRQARDALARAAAEADDLI